MEPSGGQASELIRPLGVLSGVAIKQICFPSSVLLLYILPCDLSLMSFCPMIPSVSRLSPESMYAFGVWPLELWPQQTSFLCIIPSLGHFITAPQNRLRQRLCYFFTWSVDPSFFNLGLGSVPCLGQWDGNSALKCDFVFRHGPLVLLPLSCWKHVLMSCWSPWSQA